MDVKINSFNGKYLTTTANTVITESTANFQPITHHQPKILTVLSPAKTIDVFEELYYCPKCNQKCLPCGPFLECRHNESCTDGQSGRGNRHGCSKHSTCINWKETDVSTKMKVLCYCNGGIFWERGFTDYSSRYKKLFRWRMSRSLTIFIRFRDLLIIFAPSTIETIFSHITTMIFIKKTWKLKVEHHVTVDL